MSSAGRILIMPKGEYSASVTYEMLDMVSHDGTTWLAKKTVSGIEPSTDNSEYWQNMFNMSASDYVRASGGVINGDLALGYGSGVVGSNVYGAYLQSTKDSANYRNIKIESQEYGEGLSSCARLVDVVDGASAEYKLFGEHNIELLKVYVDRIIAEYLGNND